MKQALIELHLLLLQAEAYAEQLAQVEEKICEHYPDFKERKDTK
jgi:hypothetical protein